MSPARSVTAFKTASVSAPQRPTGEIAIAGQLYAVRAAKTDVYRECAEMMAKINLAKLLATEREEKGLDAESEEQLTELHMQLRDYDATMEAIVSGREIFDEAGTLIEIKGGFLRRCMTAQDWATLRAQWKNDDSDVDSDMLIEAANHVAEMFSDWFEARQSAIGLPATQKPVRRKPMQATRKPQ